MRKEDKMKARACVVFDLEARQKAGAKKQENDKYEAALDVISEQEAELDIYKSLDKTKIKIHNIPAKKSKHDSESTALAIISDVHCDEHVDPETIGGVNEYNPEICKKRMDAFFRNTAHMINIQRSAVAIPHMKLLSLGDNMSGYLREEDYMKNSMVYRKTMKFLTENYVSGIDHLLKYSGCETFEFVGCFGNHGRLTEKVFHSSAAGNNMESIFYDNLMNIYKERNAKNITFNIANGYFVYFYLYGKKYRCHHGNNIRYGGGIGGITIPANKAINEWNKRKEAPEMDFFGHFHQRVDGNNFICCPSIIGYNAYAEAIKAAFEEPAGLLVLINNERGKTITAPIFLE